MGGWPIHYWHLQLTVLLWNYLFCDQFSQPHSFIPQNSPNLCSKSTLQFVFFCLPYPPPHFNRSVAVKLRSERMLEFGSKHPLVRAISDVVGNQIAGAATESHPAMLPPSAGPPLRRPPPPPSALPARLRKMPKRYRNGLMHVLDGQQTVYIYIITVLACLCVWQQQLPGQQDGLKPVEICRHLFAFGVRFTDDTEQRHHLKQQHLFGK